MSTKLPTNYIIEFNYTCAINDLACPLYIAVVLPWKP
jgi:hypothetical protein